MNYVSSHNGLYLCKHKVTVFNLVYHLENGVSQPLTNLNIFCEDIFLQIEECDSGGGGGCLICRVILYFGKYGILGFETQVIVGTN
jgi:hypothetical protein